VVVARLERALEERVGNDGMEPWRGFAERKFPGNLLPPGNLPPVATAKVIYPKACYDGISDGARDFVPWLSKNTDQLTLDFMTTHELAIRLRWAMVDSHQETLPQGGDSNLAETPRCLPQTHHLRDESSGTRQTRRKIVSRIKSPA